MDTEYLWYEDEVKRLEAAKAALNFEPDLIFYGSSSIRMWENLADDFSGYAPFNLGFGGSTLEACVYFFDRVFNGLKPAAMIIYAGDNDLGDGRQPINVFHAYKTLIGKIHKAFGDVPVGFVSIKPSVSRWSIIDKIRETNELIKREIESNADNVSFINIYEKMIDESGFPNHEFLEADELHINRKGYELWKETILGEAERGNFKLLDLNY